MKPQSVALFTATLLLVVGSNCLNPEQSDAALSGAIAPLAPTTLDLHNQDLGDRSDPRLLALLYGASVVDVNAKRSELNSALVLNVVRALD